MTDVQSGEYMKHGNWQANTAGGWLNGFLGVLIFSGSLPATRVAVLQFDPIFLTVARATIAGVLALIMLLMFRQKRRHGRSWSRCSSWHWVWWWDSRY
ncbi:hypothetical protein TKWG_23645 [Advenella kashmirensis WT001]|uniref:EamA domain-containing protein n=1 Tax=Advenella kashmirensis (strain DSM 17095 / LMG 22695 / WT001) TaxID=1036672 RepID=I3UH32_ADVKW|nr:hypothetical protein TKWG_23645 [Advenella kashmirensis WT001]